MKKFIATYIEDADPEYCDFEFPLDAILVLDNNGNIMTASSKNEMYELIKKEAEHYIEINNAQNPDHRIPYSNLTIYEEDMRITIEDDNGIEVVIYNIHQIEI